MRRMTLLCACFLVLFVTSSSAQIASLSKFDVAQRKAAGPGAVYNVFISTQTIPITFSKLVKGSDGKYTVGAQLSIGYGYVWILGKMTALGDDDVRIDPGFFVGANLDVGVRNDGGEAKPAASLGAIVGFNIVAVTIGYDFLGESPYVGLSSKIDVFALKKNEFTEYWTKPTH